MTTVVLTPKQEAQRLLNQLPDNATWEQMAYTMEVRADIEAGLADVKAGRVSTTEEVRREFGLPE
ncbi:MAG TPA: hypothetical protein VFM15_04730 [Gammaproteobacteria bacterium]|nr:hypothetical protein [Gammaproteobacteria bacterium]